MTCDFLIVGAGIIGLSMAHNLRKRYPEASIVVIDKEEEVGMHASGRNSGVLHAGFYYTADSLKARFTREGNAAMRSFCHEHGLAINECGKLVVARNESERQTLHELLRRGEANGVEVRIVSEEEAREIEPNCHTYREALHSPATATVDPKAVLRKLREIVSAEGTRLMPGNPWMGNLGNKHVLTRTHTITAGRIINCAGLYADRIAQAYGFAERYTILPFKGIYLKYSGSPAPVHTNIYPVPKLENPFLGVHYTVTVDGAAKIGPTAIPAFWRENYRGLSRFRPDELTEILRYDAKLFATDSFGFRRLALEEFRKYSKKRLAALASEMVRQIESERFDSWSIPGIRAQLLDKKSLELVQDFIVEGDEKSLHILNAVSPAFTCALPFTEWVIEEYLS
jgi:L-2-hydroxyglutarate oxidase